MLELSRDWWDCIINEICNPDVLQSDSEGRGNLVMTLIGRISNLECCNLTEYATRKIELSPTLDKNAIVAGGGVEKRCKICNLEVLELCTG